jgi:hypothetical protein
METSTVNPIAEIMLVVNACERLQQRFATHTVSAQTHHLLVDGSRYRPAERFFEHVNHRFLVFICAGPKQHAQLAQDSCSSVSRFVVLPISNRNSFTPASRCAMLSSPERKKYPTANLADSVDDKMRLMWSTSFSLRLSMMS